MKKKLLIVLSLFMFWACSTESDKGRAVGFITHFTYSGVFWKSWDLELNKSQTGMTSTANEMDLSIDNDNQDTAMVNVIDSAQRFGWKVQIDYQSYFATNCNSNRGSNNKFIKKIEVLDRNPVGGIK